MDYAKINEAAMGYKDDMTKFLRDLVRIPGESCGEKGHIMRIKEEMEKVGFDKVQIDPMGNILGYMGTGKTLIGFDAHIDTVGIGNIKNWEFDPYEGFESDEEIGGRGECSSLQCTAGKNLQIERKEVNYYGIKICRTKHGKDIWKLGVCRRKYYGTAENQRAYGCH